MNGESRAQKARQLVARKQLAEAIGLMNREEGGGGRRSHFLARLTTAQLCLDGGKPTLALPILEALDEDARKHLLDDWEPSLCAEVIKSLLLCHKALGTGGDDERVRKLYGRLSTLDVLAALSLDGK